MPHYCWMCDCSRPNEAYSGRGHRDHVCRECQRLPAEEKSRFGALRTMDDMLEESRISEKNVGYLTSLLASPSSDVVERAKIMLQIARLKPGKRKRYRHLRQHEELWSSMVRLGMVDELEIDAETAELAGR